MAMGYDGTIRIDTRVDTKGFNRGVQSMSNSIKPLIRQVGLLLAGIGFMAFAKSAVNAASTMSSALVGLQSIVEGTGGSFSRAQKFINDYIQDGLIPATNAITAYKNLALRGYSTEQIEKVLIALKDSAAFGRQASYTMGEAIAGATEGLKNENSVLVDNAGVTKNVAKMWQEWADAHNTNINDMTKEQKILAEVNGIMEETKFQTGDAAKATNTFAGRSAALGTSLFNLRVAIGNALIPILTALIPYIQAAINWLTALFTVIGQFISILFGVDIGLNQTANGIGDVADGAEEAAGGMGDLANNTKEAGKAAKGALASFDQLNVLAQDTGGGGGGGGGGGEPLPPVTIPPIDDSPLIQGLDEMAQKVAAFKEKFLQLITPLVEAMGRLKEAVTPLGETIWAGLKWAWDNILVPLGEWTITEAAPAFLDLLGAAASVLNEALIALQPLGQWLWENFLQPMGEWTGELIIGALQTFTELLYKLSDWIKENPEKFRDLAVIVGILAAAFFIANFVMSSTSGIATLVRLAIDVLTGSISLQSAATFIATGATTAFGAVMAFITSPIFLVILAIGVLIAIIYLLVTHWDEVKAKAIEVWDKIKEYSKSVVDWFNEHVLEFLKRQWDTFTEHLTSGWAAFWDGAKGLAKTAINGIIGFVNGLISGVISGINSMINALNSVQIDIPAGVPLIGGTHFGLNIPTITAPQIPLLAKGAVIPPNAAFLAVLGEQRNGRNLEAPEQLIRQIVREETANQNINVHFTGTMGALIRAMQPTIEREDRRIGTSLISSGGK